MYIRTILKGKEPLYAYGWISKMILGRLIKSGLAKHWQGFWHESLASPIKSAFLVPFYFFWQGIGRLWQGFHHMRQMHKFAQLSLLVKEIIMVKGKNPQNLFPYGIPNLTDDALRKIEQLPIRENQKRTDNTIRRENAKLVWKYMGTLLEPRELQEYQWWTMKECARWAMEDQLKIHGALLDQMPVLFDSMGRMIITQSRIQSLYQDFREYLEQEERTRNEELLQVVTMKGKKNQTILSPMKLPDLQTFTALLYWYGHYLIEDGQHKKVLYQFNLPLYLYRYIAQLYMNSIIQNNMRKAYDPEDRITSSLESLKHVLHLNSEEQFQGDKKINAVRTALYRYFSNPSPFSNSSGTRQKFLGQESPSYRNNQCIEFLGKMTNYNALAIKSILKMIGRFFLGKEFIDIFKNKNANDPILTTIIHCPDIQYTVELFKKLLSISFSVPRNYFMQPPHELFAPYLFRLYPTRELNGAKGQTGNLYQVPYDSIFGITLWIIPENGPITNDPILGSLLSGKKIPIPQSWSGVPNKPQFSASLFQWWITQDMAKTEEQMKALGIKRYNTISLPNIIQIPEFSNEDVAAMIIEGMVMTIKELCLDDGESTEKRENSAPSESTYHTAPTSKELFQSFREICLEDHRSDLSAGYFSDEDLQELKKSDRRVPKNSKVYPKFQNLDFAPLQEIYESFKVFCKEIHGMSSMNIADRQVSDWLNAENKDYKILFNRRSEGADGVQGFYGIKLDKDRLKAAIKAKREEEQTMTENQKQQAFWQEMQPSTDALYQAWTLIRQTLSQEEAQAKAEEYAKLM